jgi:two-component system, chemotaxis family, sensor kinase CheA
MSFEADEEILQDFLVESGEILELLSEQLVDLEQNPQDIDLLNAIFRGFHTVKGGAGFLQLDALVGCCHIAENVFDMLRNGKRFVDAELMDVVLRALDTVNEMFNEVRSGQDPTPADPQLLQELERFALEDGGSAPAAAPAPEPVSEPIPEPVPEPVAAEPAPGNGGDIVQQIASADGDITDDEFELLLDALDGPQKSGAAPAEKADTPPSSYDKNDDITEEEFDSLLDELHEHQKPEEKTASEASANVEAKGTGAASGDEITDDEFEKLLDQLHGEGQFDSTKVAAGEEAKASPPAAPSAGAPSDGASGENITDDEFENLLDELHGQGKAPTPPAEAAAPAEKKVAPPTPKPEPAPSAAPAPKPAPAKASPAAARPAARNEAVVTEATVRVDTKRLDEIMNMVGELVLVRNRLKRLGDDSEDEALQKAVSNLDVVTGDLQSAVMKTRMQPIKKVFGRFPRVVRDLARNLKKEVNLVLQGEETDLDKNLVEALSDPLVHLVRNAVDHGIEMPEVREGKGKSRIGQVLLAAEQEGDHILLTIKDDGAGMDPNVLRQKAVEKGVYDQDAADRLTDVECYNLIFAPGFSTKDEISDVSGRGVGMDVVKTKITQLNGSVNIDSELGHGSRLTIKVPLTLAIMPTLMVKLEQQAFAFPLVSVVEIFHLDLTTTNVVDGQECVVVRDKVYPLFYIKRWLIGSNTATDPESAHVVIVAVGTQRVGFVVDQLVGQEEVVIKPLGGMLHGTPGMAGATITGDGRIALILDIPSLLQRYA